MKLDKYKKSCLRFILNFLHDDYSSWKVLEMLSFNQKKFEQRKVEGRIIVKKGKE